MILFHKTTRDAAAGILREGFKDQAGYHDTGEKYSGVWVSDRPLNGKDGIDGSVLLKVDLPVAEDELARFEWRKDDKPYREWLLPAAVLNRAAAASLVELEHRPELA
jgi:hypothetical protein